MNVIQKYLIDVFDIDKNTAATILITLSVFIIGFLLTRLFKTIDNYFKRRQKRKEFIYILNLFNKELNKQAANFEKVITVFQIENLRNNKLNVIHLPFIESIISDYTTFNSAYTIGLENICKGRNYRLLYNRTIKYAYALNEINNTYPNHWQQFYQTINLQEEKRNQIVMPFMTFISTLYDRKSLTSNEREYLQELKTIIIEWEQSENNTHIYVYQKEFVEKILNLNKKYDQLFDFHKELNSYLYNITVCYNQIVNILHTYELTFRSIFSLYNNSRRVFNLAIIKL